MTHASAALILASASPRRRELMTSLGLTFQVVETDGETRTDAVPKDVLQILPASDFDSFSHPCVLAWRKAAAAQATHAGTVLGADTIVVLGDAILGKPRDAVDARQMLRRMAGRWHSVYTGVVVLPQSPLAAPLMRLERSDVLLTALSDAMIASYVATGEPLDKAGAYGIQGLGGQLVQHVRGSFTAVVGLPLAATTDLLIQAGIMPPRSVAEAWAAWRQTLTKEPSCIQQSMY